MINKEKEQKAVELLKKGEISEMVAFACNLSSTEISKIRKKYKIKSLPKRTIRISQNKDK